MVTLNRAVAVAMVHGRRAGLVLLDTLAGDDRIAGHHRLDAMRAHLLELAGDHDAAADHYRVAAQRTTSIPEQRYLLSRADAWASTCNPSPAGVSSCRAPPAPDRDERAFGGDHR
jgi:predicted RNA polymerase sigma factor